VKFLARGRGYALFLTPTEAVLSLAKPQAQARAETSATSSPEAVLAMQLAGANLEPQVTGQDALPGRVNYLRGKDPAHWQTQIPTYAKVAYEGIYPGVDLVYYGNQGQLEYDFVVAPGADPGVLKLVFRGADRTGINPAGELVLSTASGDIRMHAPVIYQETAGVRTTVAGGYVLKEPQQVSFAVAAYDTSRPLVIDPVLVYSTYLGGNAGDVGDQGNGIAVDNRGNAYVTGFTGSTDFPTVNAVQPAFGGGADAFVAKLGS
jgi:Beta-propeller repeat